MTSYYYILYNNLAQNNILTAQLIPYTWNRHPPIDIIIPFDMENCYK
jgi:hypothetical protein